MLRLHAFDDSYRKQWKIYSRVRMPRNEEIFWLQVREYVVEEVNQSEVVVVRSLNNSERFSEKMKCAGALVNFVLTESSLEGIFVEKLT